MIQGEMQAHLNGIRPTTDESPAEEEGAGNKRNGLTKKTIKTEFGPLTLDISRDRCFATIAFQPVPSSETNQRRHDGVT